MPLPPPRSSEGGAAALEYVGLLVVVAAVVVALSGFGPRLVGAVGCAVSTVTGSDGCSSSGPPTTYADGGSGGRQHERVRRPDGAAVRGGQR